MCYRHAFHEDSKLVCGGPYPFATHITSTVPVSSNKIEVMSYCSFPKMYGESKVVIFFMSMHYSNGK